MRSCSREAADLAGQSEEIGKRTGNRVLENRAAETLNNITKQQIAAEHELSKIQAELQQALAKERDRLVTDLFDSLGAISRCKAIHCDEGSDSECVGQNLFNLGAVKQVSFK